MEVAEYGKVRLPVYTRFGPMGREFQLGELELPIDVQDGRLVVVIDDLGGLEGKALVPSRGDFLQREASPDWQDAAKRPSPADIPGSGT